ncbi:MAG TPA: basic secretory protein-like protein [Verrucomicrobiae bacterium]|nr:basic secretory protein-like protein [Verrucomicrobiae bacterium]
MNSPNTFSVGLSALLISTLVSLGDVKVAVDYNEGESATAEFKFKSVPSPSRNDAATTAKFTIVDGEPDRAGGSIKKLHDDKVPDEGDQPEENFFFNAGTDGGRILVDLNWLTDVKQVNTYSWHPGSRGPQLYKLYASKGTARGFNPQPKQGIDPVTCGWKMIARVDTRPKTGDGGGQYGVSIANSRGTIGKYRYLLFDCSRTEANDYFGNTFYSEIDIVEKNSRPEPIVNTASKPFTIRTADAGCEIVIDTSQAADLADWAAHDLAPALAEWYPKIVAMLPSEGYHPPKRFSVTIKPGRGVAATSGTRVSANAAWLKSQLGREAIGSLIHEEVHVVQQYGRARRNNPNATDSPGWLVEGIPDYIRFYLFEPQNHGAEIKQSNVARARYDGSYRVTANFLNWVAEKYDKNIVQKLNAAMRDGNYSENLWQKNTGKTLQNLGDEWKQSLEKLPGPPAAGDGSSRTNHAD